MSDFLTDHNDLLLTVQVYEFSTETESSPRIHATNDSRVVKSFNVAELVSEADKPRTVIRAFLSDSEGNVISTKTISSSGPIAWNYPRRK